MNEPPTAEELRDYAAGIMPWSTRRARGVDYSEVLAGLGALGLRPPMAPMTGPNVEARQRSIAMLRELLAQRKP